MSKVAQFLVMLAMVAASIAWWDKPIARYCYDLARNEQTAWIAAVAKNISALGGGMFLILCLLGGFCVQGIHSYVTRRQPIRFRRTGLFENAMLAFIVSSFVTRIVKIVAARARPLEWMEKDVYGFHWTFDTALNSFPSGHAATVSAILLCVARYQPRLRFLCYLAIGAVAASRVILYKHYFSDAVAGVYIGAVVAVLVWHIMHRSYPKPSAFEVTK